MVKISKIEREEVVTKGFLVDYLESNEYATKSDLRELENRLGDRIGVVVEEFTHRMTNIFEAFEVKMNYRFTKLEEKIDRLESRMWKSENWLSNHEDRILKLEDGK